MLGIALGMHQRHHRNGEAAIAALLELIAHSATNSKRLEFMPLGIDPPLHLHHRIEVDGFYWTALAPDIVTSGREEQGSVSL
jgi:hypothetical protein